MKMLNFKNGRNFIGAVLAVFFMVSIFVADEMSAQDNTPSEKVFEIYSEGNKFGFKDAEGNIVTPAVYDDAREFHEGYAAVNIGAKSRMVKTHEGSGWMPPIYGTIILGGKWGFIDTNGKEIVPCQYTYVEDFCDGLAAVNIGGKIEVNNSRLSARGGKWGFVNTNGNNSVPCKYTQVQDFSNELAAVSIKGKWGFIDKNDLAIVPCSYDDVGIFSDNRAWVKQKKLYAYIDETGNKITPLQYHDAKDFSDGLALVVLNEKYGFIDKNGNEAIPCQYDYAESFSEGLAAVNTGGSWSDTGVNIGGRTYYAFGGGKWGFIDTKGNIAIPFQYNHAKSFKNGEADVILDGHSSQISKPDR
jgi:hypothetical protein